MNQLLSRNKQLQRCDGHPLSDGSCFAPAQTVRCGGTPRFRTQSVRDLGCLLDVDPGVLSWTCGAMPLFDGDRTFVPDFEVTRETTVELVAVTEDRGSVPNWAIASALAQGRLLVRLSTSELVGVRLENARELLRYASWRVSLSDRVRLLAALDQEGSLTIAEAMTTIRNGADPIAAIAALCLHRFIEIDLDSGRIGPQTRVAPFRG